MLQMKCEMLVFIRERDGAGGAMKSGWVGVQSGCCGCCSSEQESNWGMGTGCRICNLEGEGEMQIETLW